MTTPTIHLLLAAPTLGREEMACGVRSLNTQYSPPRLRPLVFTRHPRHVSCKLCKARIRLARQFIPPLG